MFKLIKYSAVFIVIIPIAVFGFFYFSTIDNQRSNISRVCFDASHVCFAVELAQTEEARAQGLMFRKALSENAGMLFVFPKDAVYPFWMKNTLIPLDMLWIDHNGRVVFIKEGAEPCRETNCPIIDPQIKARFVLEINGGLAKKRGIKIGDIASLK